MELFILTSMPNMHDNTTDFATLTWDLKGQLIHILRFSRINIIVFLYLAQKPVSPIVITHLIHVMKNYVVIVYTNLSLIKFNGIRQITQDKEAQQENITNYPIMCEKVVHTYRNQQKNG